MQRLRIALVASAAVVILGGGGLVLAGLRHKDDSDAPRLSAISQNDSTAPVARASATPVAKPTTTGPDPAELAKQQREKQIAGLDTALKKLASTSAPFSVAVLDKKTGLSYSYHGTTKFDTASIVKAQILACMLLHDQTAGHAPTKAEMNLATPMIHQSDNNAATALFQHVGGKSGVTACNKKIGLTSTIVNSSWGLTKTTANDQIKLLSKLVDKNGPLSASSRQTAFGLMSTVNKDQQWGVPSLRRGGETATVKNGWDTRTADGGLWAINTIGRITASDGHVDVSVAVLSHLNKSQTGGENLVEKVAALTRQYLKY